MTTPNRGLINQVENNLQPGVAFNWLANILDRQYGSLSVEFASDADMLLSQVQSDYAVLFLGDSGPVLTGPVDVVFPDAFPMQVIVNNTAEDLTLRKDGGTGTVLAAGDSALIACGETDVLVVAGGSGSGITDGDKGDIVVSGSGAVWSLDWAATTFDNDSALTANSSTRLPTQQAVKAAISAAIAGLSWKQAVRVATTADGTLATAYENGDTVDGVVLATGDRILLKDQSSGSENGIYVVNASGAPTRATDADSGAELVNASVYVSEGTANADKQFTCATNGPITVGSTSLTFVQLTSGSGLTNFTEAVNSSTPNATIPVATLAPNNGAGSVDLALLPKSSGALLLQVPDNTTTGGNKRGVGAVDLQRTRSNSNQVAAGDYSGVIAGRNNRASNTDSVVVGGNTCAVTGSTAGSVAGSSATVSGTFAVNLGGQSNTASANRAVSVGGYQNTADGENSVVHGYQASARSIENARVIASASGKQAVEVVPYVQTTDATPTVLRTNSSAAGAGNQFALPSNRAARVRVLVIARQSAGTGTGDVASWDFGVTLKNIAGTTTIVGTPSTSQSPDSDAGASAWTVAVSANDTADALAITVTGEASKTIQWAAYVIGPEA